jgi:hypothetical protein
MVILISLESSGEKIAFKRTCLGMKNEKMIDGGDKNTVMAMGAYYHG